MLTDPTQTVDEYSLHLTDLTELYFTTRATIVGVALSDVCLSWLPRQPVPVGLIRLEDSLLIHFLSQLLMAGINLRLEIIRVDLCDRTSLTMSGDSWDLLTLFTPIEPGQPQDLLHPMDGIISRSLSEQSPCLCSRRPVDVTHPSGPFLM